MCVMYDAKPLIFGGSAAPAAYTNVASLGNVGTPEVNAEITKVVTGLLGEQADVPPERCYVHVVDIPRGDFGWSGRLL